MDWLIKLRSQKILTQLKITCAVLLALESSACAAPKFPAWNGRLFYGDQDSEGVRRNSAKDPDFISCRLPDDRKRFNDLVCMSSTDFKSFLDTYIGGCEKWREGRPGTILVDAELFFRLLRGEQK